MPGPRQVAGAVLLDLEQISTGGLVLGHRIDIAHLAIQIFVRSL